MGLVKSYPEREEMKSMEKRDMSRKERRKMMLLELTLDIYSQVQTSMLLGRNEEIINAATGGKWMIVHMKLLMVNWAVALYVEQDKHDMSAGPIAIHFDVLMIALLVKLQLAAVLSIQTKELFCF